MEKNKTPFFIKLKNAIINFDEYKNFAEEKTSYAIKYILKIVLLFTLIVTIALTCKVTQTANNLIKNFKDECPEFSFQDNMLQIEEDKKIVKGDETGYFGFIVDTTQDDSNNVEEFADYRSAIIFLKDKLVIKNADNNKTSITYEQLNNDYDLNNINKETILQTLSRK